MAPMRVGLGPVVGAATEPLARYRSIERPQGNIEYFENTVSAPPNPLVCDAVLEAIVFRQRNKTCRGHGRQLLRGAPHTYLAQRNLLQSLAQRRFRLPAIELLRNDFSTLFASYPEEVNSRSKLLGGLQYDRSLVLHVAQESIWLPETRVLRHFKIRHRFTPLPNSRLSYIFIVPVFDYVFL